VGVHSVELEVRDDVGFLLGDGVAFDTGGLAATADFKLGWPRFAGDR
jgi:hypothetical protein